MERYFTVEAIEKKKKDGGTMLLYMLYGLTVANCWPSVFISIWVEPVCRGIETKRRGKCEAVFLPSFV
jgi:hypothetical protein